MSNYLLFGQYPKQAVVRDRNWSGLVSWSAYEAALPIPPEKPAPEWVRLRLVAERIPTATARYVEATLSFFAADPTTATNIREYLNPFNGETVEQSLGAQIEGVIAGFMPRFAATDVTDAQVQQWYEQNGFAEPPPEVPGMSRP